MVQEADTEYAVAPDGAHLAFQVVGDGPDDILLSVNTIPIDSLWENHDLADMIDMVAASARLILFDRRGMGYSDALPQGRVLTAEESMADFVAVLDAAGSQRAFVFKTDSIAPAVLLATTWPTRVAGLVLFNAYARLAHAPDYRIGLPNNLVSLYMDAAETYEMEPAVEVMCRPRRDDAAFRRWFLKALRRSAPPGAMATLVRQDFETDVRHILPLVQVPTLVIHSGANPYIRPTHGRYIAEHIPKAEYREVPGEGHLLAAVEVPPVVDHMTEFITGSPAPQRIDRVLATVMFSDIVNSTALAVERGDARWRTLLDQHDALANRQLARFGGRLVNTTGDGLVATFDGPARAVKCGLAIRDGLWRLDLDVRIGIHVGEVEMRGDDLSGIAVHVASRVQSHAASGQILATRTVVDLVAGSGLIFDELDPVELKGVPGMWALFSVLGT